MDEIKRSYDVLCDKKISMRLKDKFYRSVGRPTILYDSEYWVVDRRIEQGVGDVKMRILR